MRVCIWPRKNWIKPAVRDLAYALERAVDKHPRRTTFGAAELHYDFAGPMPATTTRIAKHRSCELQRCLRGLGLDLRVTVAGSFTVIRHVTDERIAA